MTSVVVDLKLLEEYVGSDPAELARFARLGVTSLEQALAPLEQALRTQDLATLQACGHRAKSTARHLGALAFADQCEAMERAARAGQTADALQHGQQVEAGLRPLRQAMETALQQYLGALD